MAEPEKPNFVQRVGEWVQSLVEWIEATFSDPAISAQILADLGLDPTTPPQPQPVDPAVKAKIDAFVSKQDVDEAALMAVVAQVKALVDTGLTFADAVRTGGVDAQDVLWLLFKVWAVDSLRARNPAAYGLVRLAGLITEDDEALGALDLAPIGRFVKGEIRADAEAFIDRLSFVAGTTVVALDALQKETGGFIDAAYGWDPEPADDPVAAGIAARALTVKFRLADDTLAPVLTVIGVPAAHGGPGILLSVGATIEISTTSGRTKYTFAAGAHGAFAVYLGEGGVRILSGLRPALSIRSEPADDAAGRPALLLGVSDGTRLEIGDLAYGVEVGPDFAAFRFAVRRGRLVVAFGKGDGFLKNLPVGTLNLPFEIGFVADTKGGVRFEGGTGLKVNLPVAGSILGVLTIQYVELELILGDRVRLEVRSAFSLRLGPFTAAVDQIGMGADFTALARGAEIGEVVSFLPPKGIGLRLDAGAVKGGGYLFIDPQRGEYAGALELTFAAGFGVKAIALITTKRPDGSAGWSLLLMIYAQFSVHIAFGIFLTGVGGMIGLHHGIDIPALTTGMKSGALDDVLFPADPVGDAPRIINRYRQLFPIVPDSLIIGPMLELAFSQPPIVFARLGLIFEVRNALGGDRPIALTKIVLIGQLLAQMPPKATGSPAVLKLLIDVVGFYDAQEQFLMIRARLRDSFVGIEGFATLHLGGELMLAMRFGSSPSFVMSAGGFHPAFRDFPAGVPTSLERMSVSFGFGPLKLRCETYFAITSNSVQAGFKVIFEAKIGPASLEGHFGFDALIYFKPRFRFIVGFSFAVALKAFGATLSAVSVAMQLEGPGEWHAVGSYSFSILWWDVEGDFDESWGDLVAAVDAAISATRTLLADLERPERLLPEAPVGGQVLVSLARVESTLAVAHPLGRLTVSQKSIPFDVTIDRLGSQRLTEGSARYSVSAVRVGDRPTSAGAVVDEHFARSQYMEVGEKERLGGKSFEQFPCGATVGTGDYRVDHAGATATATYEEKILEPEPDIGRFPWVSVFLGRRDLLDADVLVHVPLGAAAKSVRASKTTLVSGGPGSATFRHDTALALADATSLTKFAPLTGTAATSEAVAQQLAGPGTVVVEAFELPGA